MKFKIYVPMENINDSMLLDSGIEIASLELDNGKIAAIEIRGEVRVNYKDECYRYASEFPKELRELFENGNSDCNDDVYIGNNNWFELFYDANDGCPDICTLVDIENASSKDIYDIFADIINGTENKQIVPKYEDYLKTIQ